MNFATFSGCDRLGQWLALIEMMWWGGPARLAIICCALGSIILSSLESWYHVGNCRLAGSFSIFLAKEVADVGP